VSTTVDSKGQRYDRKIGRVSGTGIGALGIQAGGWGMSAVARIRKEIPKDLGLLTLRQEDINSVLTCGGLWQGKEAASDFPAHMFMLRRDRGWCVIPNPSIDGVAPGVSVNVWNAKRPFLERDHSPVTPMAELSPN
jgi:hypothetical protein